MPDNKQQWSRRRSVITTGLQTALVLGAGGYVLNLVLSNIAHMWSWLWKFELLHDQFSGGYAPLKLVCAIVLTMGVVILLGILMTSNSRVAHFITKKTGLDKLPWRTKFNKDGEVTIEDIHGYQPALILMGGVPSVVFIMGDKGEDADATFAEKTVATADWVSIYDPALPQMIGGKPHPMAKEFILPLLNSSFEVVKWLQSFGKKKIRWKIDLDRWPEQLPDEETLRREWGFVLASGGVLHPVLQRNTSNEIA